MEPQGGKSYDEFCGFLSQGNLWRQVCPRKGRKGSVRQGENCTKAGKHEFAVFRQNDTEHAKKKRIKAES